MDSRHYATRTQLGSPCCTGPRVRSWRLCFRHCCLACSSMCMCIHRLEHASPRALCDGVSPRVFLRCLCYLTCTLRCQRTTQRGIFLGGGLHFQHQCEPFIILVTSSNQYCSIVGLLTYCHRVLQSVDCRMIVAPCYDQQIEGH